MPAGFGFPVNHSLWTPLEIPASVTAPGDGPYLSMFGRLAEGASTDTAQGELQGLRVSPTRTVRVNPYLESLMADDRGGTEEMIAHALNSVFIMLLALCGVNVATLVFARTAQREAEISVRAALGASRGRIAAQLFAEALVLCGVGAAAGLATARFLGRWGAQLWREGSGQPMPFWWDERLGIATVLYAAALAVFAAAIIGLVPAVKATRLALQDGLRDAAGARASMRFGPVWTGIIVMQAATTVMLVATVTSLGWTTVRGQGSLDVSYPREQFLTIPVQPSDAPAVAGAPRGLAVQDLVVLTTRLEEVAGVVGATYASTIPGTTWEQFVIEFPETEHALAAAANASKRTDVLWSEGARVGPNFFETLGIPLVGGRPFTAADVLGSPNVAIVDETFVRTILGGRSPLGLTVRQAAAPGGQPGPWLEIVGVVKDVTVRAPKGPDDAVLYRPAVNGESRLRIILRTQGAAAPVARRLHTAAVIANPDLRLGAGVPLDVLADEEALPMRFFLRVFTVIAIVALLLATAGVYALISFTLARRTREIGIRAALGAAPARIIGSVFSRVFLQVGAGVLSGALPAFVIITSIAEDAGGMTRVTAAVLTCGVCALVVLIALAACAVPLRRALRIHPTEALRIT
jgi:predicted permease